MYHKYRFVSLWKTGRDNTTSNNEDAQASHQGGIFRATEYTKKGNQERKLLNTKNVNPWVIRTKKDKTKNPTLIQGIY